MFSAEELSEPAEVVLAAREGLTRRAVLDEGYSPGALLWVESGAPGDLSAELRCGPRALGCVEARLEPSQSRAGMPIYILRIVTRWYEDR